MRTVYGPNPISTPSPDVEMDIDTPEAEEVAFTLVTNKKRGKGKAKVFSPPPTNSRNNIPLVSRAPPAPKAVIASAASKPAATCPSSAAAATTTSKPAQPQNRPPLVPWPPSLSPRPKYLPRLQKRTFPVPNLLLPRLMRTFCDCFSLRRLFLTFLKLPLFLCTRRA